MPYAWRLGHWQGLSTSSYSAYDSRVRLNRLDLIRADRPLVRAVRHCELRLNTFFPSSLAQFRTRSIKRDVSSSYSAFNSSVKLSRVYFGLKWDLSQSGGCPVIVCCAWDLCYTPPPRIVPFEVVAAQSLFVVPGMCAPFHCWSAWCV